MTAVANLFRELTIHRLTKYGSIMEMITKMLHVADVLLVFDNLIKFLPAQDSTKSRNCTGNHRIIRQTGFYHME